MNRKDVFVALVVSFLIGILSLSIFKNLEELIKEVFPWFELVYLWLFPLIILFLILIGLIAAECISKKIKIIWQLAKFVVVGGLNTFIDLGVLNFFSLLIEDNSWYALFKFISFSLVVVNSYFWNKSWTFERGYKLKRNEFILFSIVAGIGILINVGTAVFLVKVIGSPDCISERLWAGIIAPFVGILIAFIWNFLGYKYIVFRKNE